MGQRHQIYLVFKLKGNLHKIGIHHQWLYGRTAVKQVRPAMIITIILLASINIIAGLQNDELRNKD